MAPDTAGAARDMRSRVHFNSSLEGRVRRENRYVIAAEVELQDADGTSAARDLRVSHSDRYTPRWIGILEEPVSATRIRQSRLRPAFH